MLSPLFTAWEHARQAGQRQALLRASLRAQLDLAREIPGDNILEVAKATRKRVKRVREIVTQLKQSAGEANAAPARCPDLDHAVGFCALLERSAERSQPDAREFDRVQRGEVSPWEHYKRHFHEPYLNVPRLQPLEVIYSKPDPEKLAKQLRATSQDQPELSSSSSSTSPARSSSPAALSPGSGPHVDVAGVTHAAGKRKTSRAQVDLVPGSGKITVNGQQLECYFRDPSVRQHALDPLLASDPAGSYDMDVRVQGGGLAGQAGAVRTAVARALCVQQPELAERLADMTRWDGRVVERKKPGREGGVPVGQAVRGGRVVVAWWHGGGVGGCSG